MDIKNRINKELFFVTDTVVDWVDIFTRPQYKHIVIDSLQYCLQQKGLVIYAWVLMSNHLHAIVSAEGEQGVPDIWRDFKKFTSKKILAQLEQDPEESRRDWMFNRFAYAGKADKKIKDFRFWQEGNHAQEIYLAEYYDQKLEYIHQNPVKAEMVDRAEYYRYSSAIDYADGKGLLDVVVVK